MTNVLVLTPTPSGIVKTDLRQLDDVNTMEGVQQLHDIVGGYIEVVRISKDCVFIVNESGALYPSRILNTTASTFYPGDIYGVVVAAGIENRPDGAYIVDCPRHFLDSIYSELHIVIARAITDYMKTHENENGGILK